MHFQEVLDALRPTKTDLDASSITRSRSRALSATATTIRDSRHGISLVVEIKVELVVQVEFVLSSMSRSLKLS